MSRKTALYVVPPAAEGKANRDEGKTFLITEMPARKAEKWATRALNLLAKSGVDLPPDFMRSGMAAMFVIGVKALTSIDYEGAEPLLDEMLDCVMLVPDASKPAVTRAIHLDTDIEEVSTYLKLRDEVFELHTGFSVAGILSNLGTLAQRSSGSDTPTSEAPAG
jgi:hypothetical protein